MDLYKATLVIYAELISWGRQGLRLIPRIVVAVLLLLLFTILSRWVKRWIAAGLNRVSNNQSLVNLTGAIVRSVVLAVGVFVALGVVGLEKTVTSLLAGAGVIALAIGFAFQDLTANFISGIVIALSRPIQVGDTVETNGFQGRVLDIKLRSIMLDNGQGQTVEIPSKDVFQKPIINFSRSGQRRIDVVAGVAYPDDLVRAQQAAQAAVRQLPFVLPHQPVDLLYRNFSDTQIQFVLSCWINPTHTEPLAAQSEVIKAIKRAFDQQQIRFRA
ncbi:mechanosensitive ion channel family protein [Fibrella sp. HMF5335]|uniref:Mechanosensitive ion channel family protein n=1 Tax=Fibrella rubiginis TaxID=2817060 RepID=A0A939K4N2_9BACT|nr:mechanosensitive ion channel family protein [Fibrella rubiginis]MBO0935575.1 mechanosensitive ion channel family protein [Fibrella rubiginis]